ncbi:MAG: glycosyltransferase family 2 protein [Betaproteobacteria bacterium]|nr:glycosyltransferase family 2 protein [Betaproteobacteria bacterium]
MVMGVYNGADSLGATLDSILSQEGCDIEFIVVNDGSTDDTGPILDEWAARDARLRVIHQANAGLTRSLISGCAVAQSEFIARQDAGDVSLPGRLAGQWKCLRQRADVVLVACATQFIGPADELLYEVVRSGHDLEQGLSALDVRSIKGPPHHGGTMFRKSAYARAGGYRPAFVVAQDIDLWLRLVELGRCEGMEQPLYRARLEANSISGRRRAEQVRLAELAIQCEALGEAG